MYAACIEHIDGFSTLSKCVFPLILFNMGHCYKHIAQPDIVQTHENVFWLLVKVLRTQEI